MRLLRSSLFAALALVACAFASAPVFAAVAADNAVYENIQQSLKTKMVHVGVTATNHDMTPCVLPVIQTSTALGHHVQNARSYGRISYTAHRLPTVEFFRRC